VKRNEIFNTDLESDFLQKHGFTYNSRTFDVLYSKKWDAEGEESSEEEAPALVEF
jgi:hypothetical protein